MLKILMRNPKMRLFFVVLFICCSNNLSAAWRQRNLESGGNKVSIALDSSGDLHFAWYHYLGSAGGFSGDLKHGKKIGTIWTSETVDSIGWLSDGRYTSIAVDSSGNPHIAAFDYTGQVAHLKYAKWTGSAWVIETIADYVGQYPSLALDGSGYPHITYYGGGLKYAKWTGSTWAIETVDSSGGEYTSLALDSSDNPHISYYSGNVLKYAAWTGSAWVKETADPTASAGWYTSLALDIGGNPHISYYYSPSPGDLKYAAWTGTEWSTQTVDSVGEVGKYTSLALDSGGNPHISYSDYTNQTLKYARWTGSVNLSV